MPWFNRWVHFTLIGHTAGRPFAWPGLPPVPRCTPVYRGKFTNIKCGSIKAPLKCHSTALKNLALKEIIKNSTSKQPVQLVPPLHRVNLQEVVCSPKMSGFMENSLAFPQDKVLGWTRTNFSNAT